jgi:ubiquinol-cytochrome c reductase cytochrome c1 subunit
MLQGERRLEVADAGHGHVAYKWSEAAKGAQSVTEYDATVRDLVNFLVYVGEPNGTHRRSIGIVVLFALGVLFIFAYLLKKEYWKDVK